MSKYDEARATDNTVLLPMSEEEAMVLSSLLRWALMELHGPSDRLDRVGDISKRLKKLTPSPGPTIIKMP